MNAFRKRIGKRKGKRRGFTITEVMVAVVILAIGMTAIAVSIISSLRISNQNRERSKALSFARMTMEQLFAAGYASTNLDLRVHTIQNPAYDGFYEVTQTTNDTKRVFVKVYWDDHFNYTGDTNRKAAVEIYGTISDALH